MKVGIMADESSSSEDETPPNEEQPNEQVPQTWVGYSWYLLKKTGRGTYGFLHYLGGKLAYGLGITTPDWQYAIDIYEDMKREEEEEREEEEHALMEERHRTLERLREMESQRS